MLLTLPRKSKYVHQALVIRLIWLWLIVAVGVSCKSKESCAAYAEVGLTHEVACEGDGK